MKVLALQTDIEWLNPNHNLSRIGTIIENTCTDVDNPDLIVLPEMFDTGFVTNPEADPRRSSETLVWMLSVSKQTGSAVTGSVSERTDEGFRNRMYFVTPHGEVFHYDKRHLFSFAGEDEYYTAGTERVIVNWRGFRILLQVCYDLRFPVFSRNRGDYDMIVYSANWPATRISVWNTLLRARAIENACYVIGVNRTGMDPHNKYPGQSAIIDYKGNYITEASDHEQILQANLDMEKLLGFREKFPVLEDADEFSLCLEDRGPVK